MVETYSASNDYFKIYIKAMVFENVEKNKDIAFYDSTNGDILSSTTQNGLSLYYYRSLAGLFTDSSALTTFNTSALAIGSVCGTGEYGATDYMDCKPCTVGTYNNVSGASECTECPVGTY